MQGLNYEELDLLREKIIFYIENNDASSLQSLILDLHSADIIEIAEDLDREHLEFLFKALDIEEIAEVLEDIDSDLFYEILKEYNLKDKKEILEEMSYDDVANHLHELDEENVEEVINYFNKEDAAEIRKLLIYEDDTAGSIMTTEFISLEEDFTVEESIKFLQKHAPDAETIYYLFVIDKYEKLSGVISLRDLIVGKPTDKVKELMNTRVISVNVSDDQEEVARIVSKYDFLAVPVIDDFDHMKGIITVDDIIDILEEEATEDMLKFAGTSEEEVESYEDNFLERIRVSIKSRLPWLIITLFGGMISASIISRYQNTLDGNAIVAIFIPILAGMGGNVGTQSSTITVRNIAVGNISARDAWRTVFHEILVGLLVGMLCSAIALVASYYIYGVGTKLALVVGMSMWANMISAATIGTAVPLIFQKIGVDPAVASAPFITMTVDLTGLTIYFTLVVSFITMV